MSYMDIIQTVGPILTAVFTIIINGKLASFKEEILTAIENRYVNKDKYEGLERRVDDVEEDINSVLRRGKGWS